MKKIVFFGIVSFFLFSCTEASKVQNVERAFYYWKSSSTINSETESKLIANKIKKIYVKFFEIDYSEAMGNYPFDKLDSYNDMLDSHLGISVVPTVFIKNEIFKYNTEKQLDVLADNIVYLINKRCDEKFKKSTVANEIQIDCDWTKSTKDHYFYLLKKIKEISKKEISCTLRLYPYKYSEIMGVPPVDKVMLMCYNLVRPLTKSDKNSILDIAELKSYLDRKRSYPVHMDVALPIFSWSQLYQNNHFQKLIDISSVDLKEFTKQVKPMWYEVTKDTTLNWNDYYRVADQIKCEEVSAATLNEAIVVIKKNVSLDATTTISLFDLNESIFKKYSNEEITGFYDTFTK
jgi:hypothetical protein